MHFFTADILVAKKDVELYICYLASFNYYHLLIEIFGLSLLGLLLEHIHMCRPQSQGTCFFFI